MCIFTFNWNVEVFVLYQNYLYITFYLDLLCNFCCWSSYFHSNVNSKTKVNMEAVVFLSHFLLFHSLYIYFRICILIPLSCKFYYSRIFWTFANFYCTHYLKVQNSLPVIHNKHHLFEYEVYLQYNQFLKRISNKILLKNTRCTEMKEV